MVAFDHHAAARWVAAGNRREGGPAAHSRLYLEEEGLNRVIKETTSFRHNYQLYVIEFHQNIIIHVIQLYLSLPILMKFNSLNAGEQMINYLI